MSGGARRVRWGGKGRLALSYTKQGEGPTDAAFFQPRLLVTHRPAFLTHRDHLARAERARHSPVCQSWPPLALRRHLSPTDRLTPSGAQPTNTLN
ncbi:hypothetical protein E2C01_015992 [Portunus trituberculatus]|uniref:Uncharacterized protein n=1 Tax=Portunus trituberculatus TaxID=210409 RepID=A0A5B7DNA6_PORTR|nr:hypothetical protein [Portunus trituberculatus]